MRWIPPGSSTATRISFPPGTTGSRRSRRGWRCCGSRASPATGRPTRDRTVTTSGTAHPSRPSATPHVHSDGDSYPLTAARLARYDAAFPTMREQAAAFGLELQRGFEVFPGALAADADRSRYALGDSGCILIEFPGSWCAGVVDEPLQAVWDEALRAERDGLLPVLAHPERCAAIWARPDDVEPFVRRGWPLCLNGSSLTGHRRDTRSTETAWRLLDAGFGDLVASDAHRLGRGPALDEP